VGSTIKNEDPEVSAGLIASFAIAPEDAVIERGGKLARLSKLSKDAERASKVARRDAEMSGELFTLADLVEEQGGNVGKQWGKTFVEVSELEGGKNRK
jgi:hypothetical protein